MVLVICASSSATARWSSWAWKLAGRSGLRGTPTATTLTRSFLKLLTRSSSSPAARSSGFATTEPARGTPGCVIRQSSRLLMHCPDYGATSQADSFAGLEVLLGGPPPPGDAGIDGQRDVTRRPAPVVGQLAGLAVAADQQPVPTGAGGLDGTPRPGHTSGGPSVPAGRQTLPGRAGQARGDRVGAE